MRSAVPACPNPHTMGCGGRQAVRYRRLMPSRPRFTIPLVGVVLLAATLLAGCGNDKWTARDVPREYPTIQAAVNAAEPGDLVRIAPGNYHEQVTVPPSKRDIVIRGVDRNRVVLDGDKGG